MNLLPMLHTLALLERVSLLLMNRPAQSESDSPTSVLRILNQTGVFFVNSYSLPLVV
jgi:hypothetical protein